MSESLKIIEIEVLRYQPESDAAPHSEIYKVPFSDDMSVLQGAQYIKDNFDGTLTFRWSCRMAICGSCGMMINGIPKLSCSTFLRDYYNEFQIAPAVRVLTKAIGKKLGPDKGNSQYLYELFPYGPAKQACKIAGLPKPTGCV